jgi:UDP-GlcNAc:undecaprenyl-phosphate GlcNAc-1-phosphate transferase
VCIGFLPHNVHVARAFMGDAGALFLGLLMAAATMVIGGRTPEYSGQSYFFFAPLFIPLFILGVPIADMAFAFVRRTARGTSFHTPDKDHLHHRLLRLGHGPRRTVLILWAWTAVLSGLVLSPLFAGAGNSVIPFLLVAGALALYTLFHPAVRRNGAAAEDESAATPAADGPGAPEQVPVGAGGRNGAGLSPAERARQVAGWTGPRAQERRLVARHRQGDGEADDAAPAPGGEKRLPPR